jgi:HD-like signal output (HDOD) protein
MYERPQISLAMAAVYSREILEYELQRLSSAPRIVPKLAALVRNPNLNPEDVIEVIRHDPSLTTRLIASCKSAAVHRGSEVTNVHEAVQCLGFSEVYRIAVVVAFRSGFCTRFKSYDASSDAVWHQAVSAACFMEEFALEADEELGLAYTMGLLHMIGMFLIDWHCSQIPGARISTRPFAKQLELERKYIGLAHTEISAMALDFWGFPQEISTPIRYYCEPEEAPAEHQTQALRLQLAVGLAQDLNNPNLKAAIAAKLRPHLTPAGNPIEAIIPKVQRRLQVALNFLKL